MSHFSRLIGTIVLALLGPSAVAGVFAQASLPTITNVWPRSAAAVGGTVLRISGSGFLPGQTTVFIGGMAAPNTSVSGPDLVLALAPPHWSPGTADVVVRTPNGLATARRAVRYVNVATGMGLSFGAEVTTDLGVFRPSTGEWFVAPTFASGTSPAFAVELGDSGDEPVLGDFDRDGRRDVAVYRHSTGRWSWLTSSSGSLVGASFVWGDPAENDVPVPGDYDGDLQTDLAVYRPAHGTWFILDSLTGNRHYRAFGWGEPGDIPVPGDYDGDGVSDIAVYRPSTYYWHVLLSSTGFDRARALDVFFGQDQHVPLRGDFDGDGIADFAVYYPPSSTWAWTLSSSGTYAWESVQFGVDAQGDVPVPGDYDGDRMTDVAVYRPEYGTWFILWSSTENTTYGAYGWGLATDIPLGGAR